MRWTLALLPLLASVIPAMAQDGDDDNDNDNENDASYPQTVLTALEGAGLTTLASALTVLAGTDGGDAFFSQLQEDDRTVFAPTNEAFTSAGFPENFSTAAPEDLDVDMLRQVLLYHIVSDDVTDDTIAVSPANTVVDTLLEGGANSPAINFGDDQSVPLVLTRESDSADGFSIFNNGEPIAVTGDATEVGNLQLYTIDQLIPLPPSLAELAESAGLTELAGALTSANLLEALNGSTGGLTIFAPNDAAFQAIASDIEGLDDATVATVLQNHVVNGTAAFSDDIDIEDGDDNDDDDSDDVTPLAGEPLTFTMMDETIMVNSGDATANIVATDYIFNGGVVHVIDAVLVNADAQVNPAPTGTTSGSPSPTATSEEDGDDAQTSAPAPSGSDAPANFAGKVSVDFATLGLVSLGAIMGGGLVAF